MSFFDENFAQDNLELKWVFFDEKKLFCSLTENFVQSERLFR